jgi:hypothetical protein
LRGIDTGEAAGCNNSALPSNVHLQPYSPMMTCPNAAELLPGKIDPVIAPSVLSIPVPASALRQPERQSCVAHKVINFAQIGGRDRCHMPQGKN